MALSSCRNLAVRCFAHASTLLETPALIDLSTRSSTHSTFSSGLNAWDPVCLTPHAASLQHARHARRVRVILTKDHPKLGNKGDEVTVKAGYARNMLHPAQQAVYASGSKTLKTQEEETAPSNDNSEAQLEKLLDKLAAAKLVTKRRLNWRHREEERMIGLVNTKHVQEIVLKQLAIDLPRELVLMQRPIEAFGEYRIPLNLQTRAGKQIELNLTVLKTLRIHGP